jgi:transcriptional regulator with XRE-family HTH domain
MTENDMPPYAKRLRAAREHVGKTVEEMAALVGLNEPSYWDLESYDDEVLTCLSIQEFARLCKLLTISPQELFAEESKVEQEEIDLGSLAAKVRSYIKSQEIALPEFEGRVGWDMATFLEGLVDLVAERYNLEAVMDLSREIGVNWVSALAGIISEHVQKDV